MSRLIDADEVLKALNSFNDKENGNEHFLCGIETAKELIKNQPTAYDADKVVGQLEKESYQEWCDSLKVVELKDAIEIVKGGGKEC